MEPVVRLRHAPNPTVAGVDADRHSSDPLSSSRQSMLDTEAASPAIAQCVRSRAPDPVIPVPPALGYQPRIVLVPLTSAPLGPGCPRDSELQTPGSLCPPSCRCPVDRRMGRRWPTFPPTHQFLASCLCACAARVSFRGASSHPCFRGRYGRRRRHRATFHGTCPARSLHVCGKIQARQTCSCWLARLLHSPATY